MAVPAKAIAWWVAAFALVAACALIAWALTRGSVIPGDMFGIDKATVTTVNRKAALGAGKRPDLPNIYLVSVDTERADHTSAYGTKEKSTPFLDELAKDGILFRNVVAPGPWTVPSMYSLITGVYPSEHGIVSGDEQNRGITGQPVLPDEATTLAELLHARGYSTFGVNTNLHLAAKLGFAQGFDAFAGTSFQDLPFTNLVVRAWKDVILRSAPFFLWTHYFDPHQPYVLHKPWFQEWNKSRYPDYAALFADTALDALGIRTAVPQAAGLPLFAKFALVKGAMDKVRGAARGSPLPDPKVSPEMSGQSMAFLRAAYMSEIRADDLEIQNLCAGLGLDRNTIIVYVADHGEEFLEHGDFGHRAGTHLYQELLHIPMVIVLPDRTGAGKVVDTAVSLVDVMPTLLDLAGTPIPASLSGRSLAPLIRGGALAPRPLFSEVVRYDSTARAIVEYPWKYIWNFTSKTGELYNLTADPAEKNDLSGFEAQRAADMRARLLAWAQSARPRWRVGPSTALAPDEIERLKAMGYLR
ncbi:MAG: sulfatase [Deltaproteobacteria bacterium]|nr:sulfatase [Deltaproteobacteria bacterium]